MIEKCLIVGTILACLLACGCDCGCQERKTTEKQSLQEIRDLK